MSKQKKYEKSFFPDLESAVQNLINTYKYNRTEKDPADKQIIDGVFDEIETNFNYSLWFNKKKRNEYNSQISNLRNVQDEFGYFQTGPIWKMPEPIGNGLMATTIFGVAAVAFSGYRFEEMFGEIYHASSMIIGAGFSLGMVLGLFTNSIHTGKQEIKKVKEQLYNRML